ncbi:hypothetical protein DERF_000263 [Dermatophagoides farinae]|uniref:Uncharacterized protein n=1 Tax=Dermatophagoides farinae TaxID=6954 RepID=A0A922I893_DERFA|nr:hypothetical protein DERF_000263 [Dermatophagoides farinae]
MSPLWSSFIFMKKKCNEMKQNTMCSKNIRRGKIIMTMMIMIMIQTVMFSKGDGWMDGRRRRSHYRMNEYIHLINRFYYSNY